MEGPRIGTPKDVRAKCPDCRSDAVVKLALEDFPAESEAMVRDAMGQGADFYGCKACSKRWAVLRVKMEQPDPLADQNLVEDLVLGQEKKRAAGANTGRRQRRAMEAWNRRLLERNKRMAKASGDYTEDPAPRPPPMTEEERKRARNARKKAAQGARR